jgi:hypothetical protein
MRTREDCKRGKGGREESRLPGISASGFFFGSHSQKKPQKCFSDYRMLHPAFLKEIIKEIYSILKIIRIFANDFSVRSLSLR